MGLRYNRIEKYFAVPTLFIVVNDIEKILFGLNQV